MTDTPNTEPPSVLDELPGDLMMWILIVSELIVFGAGLAAFMSVRIMDPVGFAESQDHLNRAAAGANTAILVTSGFLAAYAMRLREAAQRGMARMMLVAAAVLGVAFLWIKAIEYRADAAAGLTIETNSFFTFYYLLTGFHAAHVVAGIIILLLVAWRDAPRNIEVGAAFWHMVDLVWVLLFPVIYLLR